MIYACDELDNVGNRSTNKDMTAGGDDVGVVRDHTWSSTHTMAIDRVSASRILTSIKHAKPSVKKIFISSIAQRRHLSALQLYFRQLVKRRAQLIDLNQSNSREEGMQSEVVEAVVGVGGSFFVENKEGPNK